MDPALALEIEAESRSRGAIHAALQSGESRVRQMYAGTAVLVTGGSGFLGKQLIEKLLRSCDVKKVYVLLRPKKNKTVEERLSKLLSDPLFESVQKTRPEYRSLVVAVPGDVSELRAGISDEDHDILTDEVHVIFHGAATVNFASPLREAVYTNVRGTREMLALAKGCKKLKSFVYVSTAFTHATSSRANGEVLEKFYDCPVPPSVLVDFVESVSDEVLEGITPHLIQDWANTYAFSKAVTEESIRLTIDVPCCVVRPAIVFNSYWEPTPGWLDKSAVYGLNGVSVGLGLGVIHTMKVKKYLNCCIVPVDFVNNAIIVAAAAASEKTPGDEPKIYAVTSARNGLNWDKLTQLAAKVYRSSPSARAVWYPFMILAESDFYSMLTTFFLHSVPGYAVDGICWILRKPQILSRQYNWLRRFSSTGAFFGMYQWHIKDDNLLALYKTLSKEDQRNFNFDMATLSWEEFIFNSTVGAKKYIFEDNRGPEYAKNKMLMLRVLHYAFVSLYGYGWWRLLRFVLSILNKARVRLQKIPKICK